jgi:pimeloyl-ACP methyl ester carboxylesterase
MPNSPDVLWLSVAPSLKPFDQPLQHYFHQRQAVAQWDYCQTIDEACSLDTAVVLLHDYLKHRDRPVHLIGHSTSGLVGLLYARLHPGRVKSLTLLSVGVHPAVNWQAHYYVQRQLLFCSRETLLIQMVHNLFGCQSSATIKALALILAEDLDQSLSPHDLLKRGTIPPGNVSVPLMICGSETDIIVDSNLLQGWRDCLQDGDRFYSHPTGGHFFHYFYPAAIGEQILNFWTTPLSLKRSSLLTPLGVVYE